MSQAASHPGLLIVLVGPSGAGKSTISRRLSQTLNVWYTVSVTTRPQQAGDSSGKTYEYIDRKEFFRRLDSDQYLEYAQVYGEYYATPTRPALDHLAAGKDVLLEIDVQGALQVRYRYPDALLVFILPPDEPTLLRRLTDRAREGPDEIQKRFRAARREIHMAKGSRAFDHMVTNDNLERCVQDVVQIIRQQRETQISDRKQ
jgi:guanylate kinase